MTTKLLVFKLEEQDIDMQVELGNNGKYPMIELGSISFCMLAGEFLKLHGVLSVPRLTKNLLSISCMTNLNCMAQCDDQQMIIRKCNPYPSQFWPEECMRVTFTGSC